MTNRRERRNKNRIIIILIVLVVLAFFTPAMTSLSKYVYNTIHDYYLGSQGFYFNSDKLNVNHSEYEVANNWSGAETYTITVNLNSKKNDLLFAESDIDYEISFTNSDNVECTLSKTSGTVECASSGGLNEDYFMISMNPANATSLSNGETAWVDVEVTTTSPYVTTLSGRLYVGVKTEDVSYEIIDAVNNPYFEVNITNSLDTGKDVTLTFNPNVALLDMTSSFKLKSTAIETEKMGDYDYVNLVTSHVNSLETVTVKFYKVDPTQDYTYQAGNSDEPVVDLTY